MTQIAFATLLARRTGLSRVEVIRLLRELPQAVAFALNRGNGRLLLAGLGAFRIAQTKAHRIAHPESGTPIYLPKKKTVKFRAAKKLKGSV